MKIQSLIAVLLTLAGCSTVQELPRSDLIPSRSFEKVRVATLAGLEFQFERIEVVPDTLYGYHKVTVERSNARDEYWYEDVLRRQRIPLSRVVRVELVRKDPWRTAFYGAGMAAAGYLLVTLVDEEQGEPSKGSGGKPGLPPP